jgi:signal transduction histidine kinase/CheY-like chemotaxis protein
MTLEKQQKWGTIGVGLLNLFFVGCIASLFVSYGQKNRQEIIDQNISGIANLNQSSATIAQASFEYQTQRLLDKGQYIEKSGFTLDQAKEYIFLSNHDNTNSFELVEQNGKGTLLQKDDSGAFIDVAYTASTYSSLLSIFKGAHEDATASYTPEFTDSYSARKSFAFYTYVTTFDAGTPHYSTLMCITLSSVFRASMEQKGNYGEALSTVLIDGSGNYILGNPEFKGSNFYRYIGTLEEWGLDERSALQEEVITNGSGTLDYPNSENEKCVYVYCVLNNATNSYCLSCVPYASFHGTTSTLGYTIATTSILALMLAIDVFWLVYVNRQLKLSAEREAAANASKTEFFSRMSHDMRTPLNAIMGFTAITKESSELPPSLRDNLNKIDSSGQYLLGLINDVLDMSKIESGKIELHEISVDAPAFFQEIADIFCEEAKRRGIELKTEFAFGEARYLSFDPLRMKQVFSNLLSNAVKFSNSKTVIDWSLTLTKGAEPDAYELVSKVADHGCGMSKEFMDHLFNPFMQERNIHSDETTGTGLGLAIVKRLVTLMGGTVAVESELQKGTTFTVTMTRHTAPSPEETAEANVPGTLESLVGKRILLCEDNELNREIATTLLESKGLLVEKAENGEIGYEKFEQSPQDFYDAILMDIRMPVLNGLEATEKIRSLKRPDAGYVPIIAMTANAYDEDVKASIDAGMNAHLAKPFQPEILFETLRKEIAKSPRKTPVENKK